MDRILDDIEFVIFDTETTGLEPQGGDRIVEIAAVRVKAGKRLGVFHTLVNPNRTISPAAQAVNNITPQMLRDAPFINKVMPEFLDFIKGSCICAYNAAFDIAFLNSELKLIGNLAVDELVVVDILKMARRLMPGEERYALKLVAERMGFGFKQEHRALSDVELALDVFSRLVLMMKEKGINDYGNFLNLFSITPRVLEDMNAKKTSQIEKALSLGAKLKVRYLASVNARVTERELIPREIKKDKGQLYLVGYCYLRQQERSFRLDGLLQMEII